MPAVQRASAPLLVVIGLVFAAGLAFGAVAALTSPRKPEVARSTTPDTPATEPAPPTEPQPTPTTPKAEPTRKAEPKPEPKKPAPKPTTKTEAKKPDPPKTEAKKTDPPKVEEVSYVKQVLPIFKAKCNLCHGDPQKKGGLDLKTLASALQGGDSMMPGAVAGKPADSPIWTEIESGSMPKNPKDRLTDAEKKIVKDWILSGAK